jgi:hypothetical protein
VVSLERIKCVVDRLIDMQSFQDPREPPSKSPSPPQRSSLPLTLPQIPILIRQPLFQHLSRPLLPGLARGHLGYDSDWVILSSWYTARTVWTDPFGGFLPSMLQVGLDDSSLELQVKLDEVFGQLVDDR